jgi:hypothetical protein
MCTPFTTFTFAGDLTINGKTWPKYNGQLTRMNPNSPFRPANTSCYNLQGNKLTLTMDSPDGQFVNVLNFVGGRTTGTLKFPGLTATLDGAGSFN